MSIITVRQTRDPFRGDNIEYVASYKVTLEANGDLVIKDTGAGIPTDLFALIKGNALYCTKKPLIAAEDVTRYMNGTDDPIITIITLKDFWEAKDRMERAEQIKYLKGLVSRPWTWLASSLWPATSGSDESQTILQASPQNIKSYLSGLRSSILTCLRRKDGGGYVKLEEDMVEKQY